MNGSSKKVLSLAVLLIAFFAWSSWGIAQTQDPQASVKKFVQQFYDWYNQISHKNSQIAPDQRATKEKAPLFSPEIIKALTEDYEAASKNPDEVVGLDWDPFLCSQEVDDRYEVGAIKKQGQNYMVEIYGIDKGKRNPEPNVIVEVGPKDGRWIFVNFHSPHGGDLLGDLKELKKSREKPTK